MPRRTPTAPYDAAIYSISKFYIRSKDEQGHSTTMRVPDDVAPMLASLIASDDNPYESAADFFRDAGVHRLHYLMTQTDPATEAVIKGYMAKAEIDRYLAAVAGIKVFEDMCQRAVEQAQAYRMEVARLMLTAAAEVVITYPEVLREELTKTLNNTIERIDNLH